MKNEEAKNISFEKEIEKQPTCPNCGDKLTYLMPTGKVLYCNKCNKYYTNNSGVAGKETESPYKRTDVFY